MSSFTHIEASLLDTSATALAGHAANLLLEENRDPDAGCGADSFSAWRANLSVRLRELAVAIEFDAPELFVAAIDWCRTTFEGRDLPEESLRRALVCLQRVIETELPETARTASLRCVEPALQRFTHPAVPERPLDPKVPHQKLALQYIETCLSGHPSEAMETVLSALDNGHDATTASELIVSHALHEVGRLWHSGKLGAHEEHLVTSTTLALMARLAHRERPALTVDKTVVGAAVGDNAHDLGVRLIMDSFTLSGWRSICLGGHLPAADIAQAVVDFDADLLVLSATLVTQLVTVRDTIVAARLALPHLVILVGGLAVQAAPDLWRKLGADGHSRTAWAAVEEGRRLVGTA